MSERSAGRTAAPRGHARRRAGGAEQLRLVDTPSRSREPKTWQLDDRTRQIGLRGVAEARAILDRARANRESAERLAG